MLIEYMIVNKSLSLNVIAQALRQPELAVEGEGAPKND